ncbi:MAG: hypothetical protein KatS3mg110_1680 [Pirellulaceae bacterium]|nr:MAG: hypothetical protein KatS3mg110_1680 [Pirellulaceae bacterium]
MPAFHVEVPHSLGQEGARQRLDRFIDEARQRLSDRVSHMEGQWQENTLDFSLTTFGMKLTGKLIVEADRVRVEGQLPFAAVAFRGQIEQTFRSELRQALGAGN